MVLVIWMCGISNSEYRIRAIISCSRLEAALEYKPYIRTEFSEKNFLKNKEMVFGNGVKDIQAAAYNGARTVLVLIYSCLRRKQQKIFKI